MKGFATTNRGKSALQKKSDENSRTRGLSTDAKTVIARSTRGLSTDGKSASAFSQGAGGAFSVSNPLHPKNSFFDKSEVPESYRERARTDDSIGSDSGASDKEF